MNADGADEPADMVASLDQSLAAMALRAKLLHGYFCSLHEEGFKEDQALELVRDYQQNQWPEG